MLTWLRIIGFGFLGLGFVGIFVSMGFPFMLGGSPQLLLASFVIFLLGWLLLTLHAILFLRRFGWAASGITLPGMIVVGIGFTAVWWFLFGPKASSYPAEYGLGTALLTLVVTSYVLPRIYRQR